MQVKYKLFAVAFFFLSATAINGQSINMERNFSMEVMGLAPREAYLAAMASCAARDDMEQLAIVVTEALEAGITIGEAKEALIQLYAYCGFPRSLNALTVLWQVTQQRRNEGIVDAEGVEPAPFAETGGWAKGTENQTRLCGKEIKGGLYEFVPQIDYYLKAHLFGDIFGRDNLDWRTREIVTVAALASMTGVEAQRDAHIGIALHNGVTKTQIADILAIVDAPFQQMFPKGEPNDAYTQYFTGQSWLAPLTHDTALHCPVANVTFEPKCRNNWHGHTGGQLLIVTAGEGWYQERGKAARRLKAGDVVEIPCNVEHWHGAAADSWFAHIAVTTNSQTNRTTWLEPVSDEEYNAL